MILLYSCAGDKAKDKEESTVKEETNAPKPSSETSNDDDMAIKKWLIGKEWKAENDNAPFSILRVFSKDSCGFVDGTYHYTFKNGRFENLGAEWPFTKVNDTTFTIFVEPTQKTFAYKFVRNL
jgi:hypothetical protein